MPSNPEHGLQFAGHQPTLNFTQVAPLISSGTRPQSVRCRPRVFISRLSALASSSGTHAHVVISSRPTIFSYLNDRHRPDGISEKLSANVLGSSKRFADEGLNKCCAKLQLMFHGLSCTAGERSTKTISLNQHL